MDRFDGQPDYIRNLITEYDWPLIRMLIKEGYNGYEQIKQAADDYLREEETYRLDVETLK